MGTITTDGNTGALSSTDITGFDLTYEYGAYSSSMTPEYGFGGVTGPALFASPTALFFTTGSGGGTLSFVAGNGYDVIESLSDPVCLDLPCNISDPAALNFFLEAKGDVTGYVTGSIPFTAATMPIATVTPEPATAVLYFVGLGLIVLLRRRIALQA
ncbi:MAG: PEP-CTERM sorting domain-containing protein [Candidatus Acidiferrales bacterium]